MTIRWKLFISILIIFLFSQTLLAGEDAVKKAVQRHFEGHAIDSLKKTPYLGLYEVVVGDEVFYTDEKANYFLRSYDRYQDSRQHDQRTHAGNQGGAPRTIGFVAVAIGDQNRQG